MLIGLDSEGCGKVLPRDALRRGVEELTALRALDAHLTQNMELWGGRESELQTKHRPKPTGRVV